MPQNTVLCRGHPGKGEALVPPQLHTAKPPKGWTPVGLLGLCPGLEVSDCLQTQPVHGKTENKKCKHSASPLGSGSARRLALFSNSDVSASSADQCFILDLFTCREALGLSLAVGSRPSQVPSLLFGGPATGSKAGGFSPRSLLYKNTQAWQ